MFGRRTNGEKLARRFEIFDVIFQIYFHRFLFFPLFSFFPFVFPSLFIFPFSFEERFEEVVYVSLLIIFIYCVAFVACSVCRRRCVNLPLDRCSVLSLIVCKARSKFHLSIAKALLGLKSDIILLV